MARIFTILAFIFFLAFSLALPTPSSASTSDDAFILGKHQLTKGNFEKAYDLLFLAFLDDPANPDINFFLGRAAFEKAMVAFQNDDKDSAHSSLEAALMAFDRILIVQPNAVRIKLEIARCHMQLGSFQTAKQYFLEVLASNPPDAVKKNVDYLMAAIATTEKRNFFSSSVSLGFDFDDNARSSQIYFTDVALPGSGITLTNVQVGAVPDKDAIATNTVAINHIYKFLDTPYSWKTSLISYNTFYSKLKDLNINLLGLTSGPTYQTDTSIFEFHGILNNLTLGYDEYVRPIGFGGSAIFLLDPKIILNSSFSLENKKYSKPANANQDANNYNFTLNPIFVIDDNRLNISIRREWENADTDFWSYDRIKWSLRYDRILPEDFSAFVSLTTTMTDYDAIQTGQTVKRSDTIQDFYLGLSKQLWLAKDKTKSLSLQLSYTHTKAKSNLPLYIYRKKVISTLMTYGF